MDSANQAQLIAVGGTLLGGVLGWAGNSAQSRWSARGSRATLRDELFGALARHNADLVYRLQMVQATDPGPNAPVGRAKLATAELLPAYSMVFESCARMSILGSDQIRYASWAVTEAAQDLATSPFDRDGYAARRHALNSAMADLWHARDLDATRWWQLIRRRRHGQELKATKAAYEAAGGA